MTDLIHQFIAHSAQATPEAPALLFKDQSLNYAQLQYKVDATANALLGLGYWNDSEKTAERFKPCPMPRWARPYCWWKSIRICSGTNQHESCRGPAH